MTARHFLLEDYMLKMCLKLYNQPIKIQYIKNRTLIICGMVIGKGCRY